MPARPAPISVDQPAQLRVRRSAARRPTISAYAADRIGPRRSARQRRRPPAGSASSSMIRFSAVQGIASSKIAYASGRPGSCGQHHAEVGGGGQHRPGRNAGRHQQPVPVQRRRQRGSRSTLTKNDLRSAGAVDDDLEHGPPPRPIADHLQLRPGRFGAGDPAPGAPQQGHGDLRRRGGPAQPRQVGVVRVEPDRDLTVAVAEDHRPVVVAAAAARPGAGPEQLLAAAGRPVDHGGVGGRGRSTRDRRRRGPAASDTSRPPACSTAAASSASTSAEVSSARPVGRPPRSATWDRHGEILARGPRA